MAQDWEAWIRDQKQQGHTRQEVREYLSENGYDAGIVDEYWASTSLREMQQPTVLDDPSAQNLFDTWRTVMTSPAGFFRRTDLAPAPAAAFAGLCLVLHLLLTGTTAGLRSVLFGGSMVEGFISALPVVLMIVVGVGISGLLYFVLLTLLGGGASLVSTMSVMLYSLAPLALTWVPFVGWLAGLFTIFIQIAGLTEINDVTRNRVVLAFIIQLVLGIVAAVGSVGLWMAPLLA